MMQIYVRKAVQGFMNKIYLCSIIAGSDRLESRSHILRVEHGPQKDEKVSIEAVDSELLE